MSEDKKKPNKSNLKKTKAKTNPYNIHNSINGIEKFSSVYDKFIPSNPDNPIGSKKIIPCDIEAPKLRQIFDLYLKLKSVQKLMHALRDLGIVTIERDSNPWYIVKSMLTN